MSEESTIADAAGDAEAPAPMSLTQETLEFLAVVAAEDPGSPYFPALAEAYRRAGQADAAARVARAGLARGGPNPEGELALALALVDCGEGGEAVELLADRLDGVLARAAEQMAAELAQEAALSEAGLANPAFGAEVQDAELDVAFAEAESDPEEMFDVNRVAERVLEDEGLDDGEDEFEPGAHPSFATETMATLLEGQGDAARAESIRAGLEETDAWAEEAGPAFESLDADPVVPDAQLEPTLDAGTPVSEPGDAEAMDAGFVPDLRAEVAVPAARSSVRSRRRERILATLETWLANIRREVR